MPPRPYLDNPNPFADSPARLDDYDVPVSLLSSLMTVGFRAEMGIFIPWLRAVAVILDYS